MNPEGLRAVQDEILMSGVDDLVHIPEVLSFTRDAFPDLDEPQALPIAVRAVKDLVADGLAQVGTVVDGEFVPWPGTHDEVGARIDDAAQAARFPLVFGDLFWIRNTPQGSKQGNALLDA